MYALEQGAGVSPASGQAPLRAGMAQAVVAHVYDVTLEEMRAQTRGAPRAALARQVAMYLSHIVFGMSVNEIAAAFMRHRSTAHYALRHVEDLRDDAEVDRSLELLETMLVGRRA
jgi:chromosomal replication initiation ATPase DnaA